MTYEWECREVLDEGRGKPDSWTWCGGQMDDPRRIAEWFAEDAWRGRKDIADGDTNVIHVEIRRYSFPPLEKIRRYGVVLKAELRIRAEATEVPPETT